MKVKAVLFDIDGTIIDTYDFVYKAVDYTLKFHKLTVSPERLQSAMGRPLIEFYKFIFPDLDFMLFAKTHDKFQADKFYLAKPFNKVAEVLKKIKDANIKIAAVSNRTRKSVIKSLKLGKLDEYFDVIVAVDDVENPKPHQEHALKALDFLKVKPADAIMVGDTDHDIMTGKNAGIKTVGVSYGWFGENIKNHKPDFVIDNLEELLKILNLG